MSTSPPTFTFLFTDIEGSTRRWEHQRDAMADELKRHDELLRDAVVTFGGTVFKTVGDAFCTVFASPVDAIGAALAAQRGLAAEPWSAFGPDFADLRVRMAIHTRTADVRNGDFFGPDVNRVARLLAAGRGRQVLLSAAAVDVARPSLSPDVSLRDMGERRLKDLRRTEHVYQLLAPGLAADFPPLATLDARPNNLPLQPTSLVGREAEVAELVRLFRADAGQRLITLTGPGGTGKTRLALQAAAELVDDFDHGVWFVDLAPVADSELVAATLAEALAVPGVSGQDTVVTLRQWLRDRNLLLVLDNYERLLGAAPLVAELLASAPRVKALVTSREVLRLRGERTMPVQPLAVPPLGAVEPLATLLRYDAVSLFLQRATDGWPEFVVTTGNAPVVAQICARLDGLPLAIELAAVRVRSMAVEDILARLDHRLRLLTQGQRDLPERHRTIRAAIAWSYDLLEPAEQRLFERLAVFIGGVHLESAEAVSDEAGDLGLVVVDGLASLVEKSLLRRMVADDGWSRYRMLETVREFAGKQLATSGEAEAIRARHARHFVDRCQRMWLACEDLLSATAVRRYTEPEEDNLRAALDWCRKHDPEAGLALAGALNGRPFRPPEGRRWIMDLLELAPAAPPTTRAGALVALGSRSQDHKAQSAQYHQAALELYLAAGDDFGAAIAQVFLCFQLWRSGQVDAYRANMERGRALAEASGNLRALCSYHWLSGAVACDCGDLDGYLAHNEAIRQTHLTAGGEPPAEDWVMRNMNGSALYFADHYTEARNLLDSLVAEFRARGEVECATWDRAGRTYLALDQVSAAEKLFREGLVKGAEDDNHVCTIWHLEGLASVALRQGRARDATLPLGAAATDRTTFHLAIEPAELPRRERELAELRAALGDAGTDAALAAGRALGREAAIRLALSDR